MKRVSLLIVMLALSARADESALRKMHFDRANHLVNGGDHAAAIVEFKAAYDVAPHPNLLFNIAKQYEAESASTNSALDVRHAIDFYRRYLEEKKDASNRAEVEASIATLETREKALTATVSAPTPISQARTVMRAPPDAAPGSSSPRRRIGVVVAVAAAAVALTGGILAAYAASSSTTASSASTEGGRNSRLDTATLERNIGVALAAVGAAAVVVGIVVLATGGSDQRVTLWLAPSSSGVMAGGAF